MLTIAALSALYVLPRMVRPLPASPAPVRAAPVSKPRYSLGVFEPGELASYRPVSLFAATVGQRPDLVLYYSNWHTQFQATFAATAYESGATTIVQIAPFGMSLAKVAAGQYDGFFRKYADEVRNFHHRVVVSFAPEANGRWYAWGWTHTPASTWVAAWRHVVTVFRDQGAANAIWMWTVNAALPRTGPVRSWWPGANYVNWVGIDGYYFERSATFQSVFSSTVQDLRKFTGKPILLSEVGIGQVAGQAAKIPGLFGGITRDHLLGLVWFDMAQHSGLYHQNWRLEGHPAGVAAFRAGLRSLEAGPPVPARPGPRMSSGT